ncbi:MAG: hypothetical protein LBC29_01980 [Propionibacteriaceae bacterium]|jgi:DNA-directed RNA polymerase specialized sigma24 family protein|nr:hypothetical protein [Propionibacteriaceae bacterium]
MQSVFSVKTVAQIYGDELTYRIDTLSAGLADTSVEIIIKQLRAGDDSLALELLIQAQEGNRAAGELVLRALAPRLAWQCRRDPALDLADYSAAAWERIMRHPVAKRRRAVLINIALDALKLLSREHAVKLHEIAMAELPEPHTAYCAEFEGQDELPLAGQQIIELAARRKLIPAASIRVLRSVYLAGLTPVEAARVHDTTPAMIRYRCSVAIRALREHRQELLNAIA